MNSSRFLALLDRIPRTSVLCAFVVTASVHAYARAGVDSADSSRATRVEASGESALDDLSKLVDRYVREGSNTARSVGRIEEELHPSSSDWIDLTERGFLRWVHTGGGRVERPLDAAGFELAHHALSLQPWSRTRAMLQARIEADPSSFTIRTNAIRIGGAIAPARELDTVWMFAVEGDAILTRSMRSALRTGLAVFFARHPDAARRASSAMERLEQPMLRSVITPTVFALEDCGTVASLDGLATCFGRLADADPLVATSLARVADRLDVVVPQSTATLIRAQISSPSSTVRLECVKALGRLDDVKSIPLLIESLGDQTIKVRRAAYASLEAVTGERQIPEPDTWRRWYEDAERWRRKDLPAVTAQLRSGRPALATRALLELSRYRVFRHKLSPLIIEASKSDEDSVARVAASSLGHFGTRDCIAALPALLDHRDVEVRRAAYLALKRCTRRDCGDQRDSWERELMIGR